MSLAHITLGVENELMTDQQNPNSVFDPKAFREAMGPGYGVASFREQAAFTGQSATARQSLPPSDSSLSSKPAAKRRVSAHETWLVSLHHQLLLRVDHLFERSHSFTQTRLSKFEDPQPVQTCC